MATQFEIDYALMAGLAYQSNRDKINWFPAPSGWQEFSHVPNSSYPTTQSFEASAFQNLSTGEIVIAYAGTAQLTDWLANVALGLGFSADQLNQAAEYYLEIKAANPGAVISFTGHSLGGGLAALMGVMFDEQAITFDQAPFANSASTAIRDDLVGYLHGQGYNDGQLMALAPELFSYQGGGDRVANVSGYFVQGEALQYLPFSTLGLQAILNQSSTGLGLLGSVDLHSQALLSTFLLNDAFRSITFKLPELLKMVFDEALYAYSTNTGDVNFLEHLIRHQTGVQGSFVADSMLDRFTQDLQKVAQDSGFTLTNEHITRTLVAFAMQKYYEELLGGVDYGKALFGDVVGGLRFDREVVADSLGQAKGYALYFQGYLDSLPAAEQAVVRQLLPAATDWFIQAGTGGMTATDTLNRGDFMLGGSGADSLGGAANDYNHELEERAA